MSPVRNRASKSPAPGDAGQNEAMARLRSIRLAPSDMPTMGVAAGKLAVPALTGTMVERKRLLDRLTEGKQRSLIVISGVAGSGKTTLACQWIAREKLPVAWYSLDETDNDPDLFFRHLLAALGAFEGGSMAEGALTRGRGKLAGQEAAERILACLASLSRDVYLALDGYQFVANRKIHDSLFYLLDRMERRLHVLITTRYAIPFSLSGFKVKNQLVEISASDLRFTEEEAERFFSETIPIALSPDKAREAARHAEGWVSGLQLLGLSLREKEIPDDLEKAFMMINRDAADYLENEVLNTQPEKVRSFLKTTALLDRFNADICNEIMGMADSDRMLRSLCRNNLFLVPLDGENKWYRYHRLFSEALRRRAKRESPEATSRIHRQAALWFARNGDLDDAFRHAVASEDLQFAADIFEDNLTALYDRYEIASFRKWLSKLPYGLLKQRVLLKLQECRLKIESIQLLEAEALLKELEEGRSETFARYDGSKRQLCDDHLLLFKCVLPFWLDPLKVDIEEIQHRLAHISRENKSFAGMVEVIIGASRLFRGELSLAYEVVKKATSTVLSCDSFFIKMLWFRLMAEVERLQGHLHRAEAILGEGFELLERAEMHDSPVRCFLYFGMGWVHYLQNDIGRAFDFTSKSLKYLDQTGFAWEIVEDNFLLGLLHAARGEAEGVSECASKIQAVSRACGELYVIGLSDAYCARLYLAQGDLSWVERWAERRRFRADGPFSSCFVQEGLAMAELLNKQGRCRDAIDLLGKLREQCADRALAETLLDIDLLACQALYALDERDKARTVLKNALAFSETEGYVRPFVNYASGIAPVLTSLARTPSSSGAGPRLEKIMKACGIEQKDLPPKQETTTHLSPRELEMLKLLAMGYKYREISDKAYISIDTVRTHIRRIFEKMGVNTRMQAVQKAERLGILG